MSAIQALRRVAVEAPGSIGARARLRRWELFEGLFPDLAGMRILDLGGTVEFWAVAPVKPRHVTVLNLFDELPDAPDWVTPVVGDACSPPTGLLTGDYDLAYSNSVIEHVGGAYRRQQFADTVRQAAPAHWVQTPYRYFPVEPHWLFPGAQFLPVAMRAQVVSRWPLLNSSIPTHRDAVNTVLSTELIGRAEMRHYFPDAELFSEKVAGLPKSLIAVRGASGTA